MTQAEFSHLREGDIVQSAAYGLAYIVTMNLGNRVIAVRTIDMTNPDEWHLVPRTTLEAR